MTRHARWVRRALALWAGLLAAWGAAAVVAYLRYRDHLAPVLLATALLVVVFGGVWTARLRAEDREPFISVEDLRKR